MHNYRQDDNEITSTLTGQWNLKALWRSPSPLWPPWPLTWPGTCWAPGSTTTSPRAPWPPGTQELEAPCSPGSLTGIDRLLFIISNNQNYCKRGSHIYWIHHLIFLDNNSHFFVMATIRYFETRKRVNYIGDCSAGGAVDFRHYNYRYSSLVP